LDGRLLRRGELAGYERTGLGGEQELLLLEVVENFPGEGFSVYQ
jgi:hypothetical protein